MSHTPFRRHRRLILIFCNVWVAGFIIGAHLRWLGFGAVYGWVLCSIFVSIVLGLCSARHSFALSWSGSASMLVGMVTAQVSWEYAHNFGLLRSIQSILPLVLVLLLVSLGLAAIAIPLEHRRK